MMIRAYTLSRFGKRNLDTSDDCRERVLPMTVTECIEATRLCLDLAMSLVPAALFLYWPMTSPPNIRISWKGGKVIQGAARTRCY